MGVLSNNLFEFHIVLWEDFARLSLKERTRMEEILAQLILIQAFFFWNASPASHRDGYCHESDKDDDESVDQNVIHHVIVVRISKGLDHMVQKRFPLLHSLLTRIVG